MPRRLLSAGVIAGVAGVPLAAWPAGFNPYGPVKLAVLATAAALVLVGIALDGEAREQLARTLHVPPTVALFALAGIALLSSLVAADPRTAFLGSYPGYEAGLLPLALAACSLAGVVALGERVRTLLPRTIVAALVVVGALALAERAGLPVAAAREYIDVSRVRSTLGNAANLGLWAACALPWAAVSALTDPVRAWRMAGTVAVVLGTGALVLSGSRGALVALVIALVAWGFFSRTGGGARPNRRFVLALAAVLIALAAVSAMRATSGGVDTARGRIEVWSTTASLVAERPFLGWGPGGFGRAYAAHMPELLVDPAAQERALEDPHNVVLSAAVSLGPLGAVAVVALAAACSLVLWRARGKPGSSPVAGASLAAAFAGLQFHFVTLDIATIAFASLGAVALSQAPASARASAGSRCGPAWWVLAAAAVAVALAAWGTVAADMHVARGYEVSPLGGTWRQAAEEFDSARGLAPWEPVTWWAKGRSARSWAAAGAPDALDDGLAALSEADRLRPGDARIVRDEADLLAAAGLEASRPDSSALLETAVERYDEALRLAPNDPLAWGGRGGVLLTSGRVDEAAQSLTRAVALAPRYSVAWLNLAEALEATGDAAGAQRAREVAREVGAPR